MNTTAMEPPKYYWSMWARGGGRWSAAAGFRRPAPPQDGDSWEEQAFAQDAAGQLGGGVWPPRFYACSFCRREFRSAQALGGHMNVHRRDRARLRQCSSPPPPDAAGDQPRHEHATPCSVLYTTLPSRARPQPSGASAAPSPPPSYISAIIRESRGEILVSPAAAEEAEEAAARRKRRRIEPAVFPFVLRPPAAAAACDKVPKITSPSSVCLVEQEVDLELRLGTSPKVT